MIFSGYTKRDTSIVKGFAILCIVFHNFFHWLPPSPGENEFDFSPSRVRVFFQLLGDRPSEIINICFSYLGYYGVQLFILISGFGLAVSMMNHPKTWEAFVFNRLKKLYPLLLIGLLTYFLGVVVMEGRLLNASEQKELVYKLLLIHTLIPGSELSLCGPWWFFGLIFQLYLLFPLLFRCIKKWGWKAFAAVCIFSYALIYVFSDGLNLYHGTVLMKNAPGHLPEFCLGILLACSENKKIHWSWLVLAVILFVWGNFTPGFYPFTFLSLCVITVFVTQSWKSKSKRWKKAFRFPFSVFHYFGGISMALFVVHGMFRKPVLSLEQWMDGSAGVHLLMGLIYFLIVWAVAVAVKRLYDVVCSWLDKIFIREGKTTRLIGRVSSVLLVMFFLAVAVYFVAQNINRYDRDLPLSGLVRSGIVTQKTKYFAATTVDQRALTMRINASFDICSQDTLSPLPSVALDVTDMFWMTFDIPKAYNTGETQHYEFSYDYLIPFTKNVKNKPLHLYFWNPKGGKMSFENVKVTILY
jgi:peptidoglycan/LPS O-acetylase OafA/YrhL